MHGQSRPRFWKNVWPVRHLRQRRYETWFTTGVPDGLYPFRGIYASYAAAARAIPPDRPVGYNVEGAAELYVAPLSKMAPSDYPMVFWLGRILEHASLVFDFGGHVGTKYRAFAQYLKYPAELHWRVCEVPVVAAEGRRIAEEQGDAHLEFTSDFAEADNADVLLASGVVQYVETPFWRQLAALRRPPKHVLLNKTPWRYGGPLYTVQNLGIGFTPYQVFDRVALLRGMGDSGYALVDQWDVLDRSFAVPFHPEATAQYVGLYFRHR